MLQIDRELNRRLMILSIHTLSADGTTNISLNQLREKLTELGGEASQVNHEELKHLVDLGWLSTKDMSFEDEMGHITTKGRDEAESLLKQRSDVMARRIALRDLLLYWLYEETQVKNRNYPPLDDFMETGKGYFGVSFDKDDLDKAAGWLADSAYIGGTGALQRRLIRVSIEKKGVDLVERNRSVMDEDITGNATFNTTVNGPANIANQSPGSSQIIDQSQTWIEATKQQLDAVEQAVATFDSELQESITGVIGEVHAALEDENKVRTKAGLEKLVPFLSSTSAGALGNLISAGVLGIIAMLG